MTEKNLKGQCLCGEVQFFIKGKHFGIYQCHCSECRKITGSSANASCIVPVENFMWLKGESRVSSYIHDSGYRSDFCAHCGSATPNIMKNGQFYWVPAGAFEDTSCFTLAAHICVASKASWDAIESEGVQYEALPTFEELVMLLLKSKQK